VSVMSVGASVDVDAGLIDEHRRKGQWYRFGVCGVDRHAKILRPGNSGERLRRVASISVVYGLVLMAVLHECEAATT